MGGIKEGEVLVSESPVVVVSAPDLLGFLSPTTATATATAPPRWRFRERLEHQVSFLSPALQRDFRNRHGATTVEKYRRNALPLGRTPASFSGFFPICSRFNHSCSPNATFVWAGSTQQVVSTADIPANSEITVSYAGDAVLLPLPARRTHLEEFHGFVCGCAACESPDPAQEAWRQRLLALQHAIDEATDAGDASRAAELTAARRQELHRRHAKL